jgi:hypothetical protein
MSEIPFVKALGDEIERSAAERIATRGRRIRRRITFGAIGFAIAATGVAAASGVLWSSPEQLASTSVGCYEKADPEHSGVSVVNPGEQTPVQACRRFLGDGPLVACADAQVVVLPGGPGTCKRLGLAPVPAGYEPAREQFNRLAGQIMALERARDCWPPEELAARVQDLLDRSPAWHGWKAEVNRNFVEGPCGTVSYANGDGSRSVEGAVFAPKHTVEVTLATSRSTYALLIAADSPGNRLLDASGERCYTVPELEVLARDRLAAAHRPISLETVAPKPGVEITDARQARLDEGCAVITQVRPTKDDRAIVVEVWTGR